MGICSALSGRSLPRDYCQRNVREAIPKQITSQPARAVGSEQPEDLAFGDIEVDACDSLDVAVALGQAAHPDDRIGPGRDGHGDGQSFFRK
jgi:hypothetical protein